MMLKFCDKTDKKIPQKLFCLCENIIYYCIQNVGDFADNGVALALVNTKAVRHITEKIKKPKDKNLKSAQKMLIHLQLLLLKLHESLQ